MDLTYVELFAGAGGMSLGLEMAGWRCVAHAEIEPHARAVLRHHWPDVPLFGDVSQLDGRQFKGVTMLTGGSPCQDLSIAGKRAGMADGTRSSLFFEQVRIWNEMEAPFILWENVYGAFSSNDGRDFAAVLAALVGADVPVPAKRWKRAGYVVGPTGVAAWRTLDAQYFGVPQRRRRVFVLGSRDPRVDPAQVLSLLESLSGHSASSGKARQSSTADSRTGTYEASGAQGFSFSDSVGYLTDVMPTIPVGVAKGTGSQMMGVLTYSTPAIGDIREDSVASTITKNSGGGGETQNPAFVVAVDVYNQTINTDGIAHTIRAHNAGEGIPHTISFDNRPLISTDGVKETFTTEGTRNPMSVVMGVDRQNGLPFDEVAPTLKTDVSHQMGPIVMRQREGKPGGGKGPLLSAERSLTLGTSNDQVVFGTLQATDATKWGSNQWVEEGKVHLEAGVPRRLTPMECERLMGWPDLHTAVGINEKGVTYELADTARYKLCGNGIASPVTAWIGFQLRAAVESL